MPKQTRFVVKVGFEHQSQDDPGAYHPQGLRAIIRLEDLNVEEALREVRDMITKWASSYLRYPNANVELINESEFGSEDLDG